MQRLAERQHVSLARVVDGHAGPGQEGGQRSDIENAAAMPRQAIDEHQRQFGERPHIDVDHRQLLVAADSRGGAAKTEAGIVDDDGRLHCLGRKLCRDDGGGIAAFEIRRQHRRPRPAGRRDLVGERVQPILPPRQQDEFVAVRGKDPRQRGADAG